MTNKRMGEEGLNKRMDEEGVNKRSASEDDVEGHRLNTRSAPDEVNKRMGEEGVNKRSASEDDVEGHMIGTMNPVLARDLARAKEADIRRATSRSNLVNDTKKSDPRKG